jgi:lactobin A/cerein 7B family class IIb bacteriocin
MNLDSIDMREVNINELADVEGGIVPLLVIGAYIILGGLALEGGILLGNAISHALPCR